MTNTKILTSTGERNKENRNGLLYEFRLSYDGSAFSTHEWLFQLARHWILWQSSRIGTFPLDYRDPSGPVTREDSEETGEDYDYWAIEDILNVVEREQGSDAVQDMIVHTTKVLARLDDWLSANGHGI